MEPRTTRSLIAIPTTVAVLQYHTVGTIVYKSITDHSGAPSVLLPVQLSNPKLVVVIRLYPQCPSAGNPKYSYP